MSVDVKAVAVTEELVVEEEVVTREEAVVEERPLVQKVPPRLEEFPKPQALKEGETLVLSCKVSGQLSTGPALYPIGDPVPTSLNPFHPPPLCPLFSFSLPLPSSSLSVPFTLRRGPLKTSKGFVHKLPAGFVAGRNLIPVNVVFAP